jgi:hypothetical protein
MPFSLRRQRDGAGDSGNMSLAIHLNAGPGNEHIYEHGARPQVGAVMRVGSALARSYDAYDWWQTTPITEITDEWTEDGGDGSIIECVRFKTGNSTYVWKHF